MNKFIISYEERQMKKIGTSIDILAYSIYAKEIKRDKLMAYTVAWYFKEQKNNVYKEYYRKAHLQIRNKKIKKLINKNKGMSFKLKKLFKIFNISKETKCICNGSGVTEVGGFDGIYDVSCPKCKAQ